LHVDVELQREKERSRGVSVCVCVWFITDQIVELPGGLFQNHLRDRAVSKDSEREEEEGGERPKAPEVGVGMVLVDRCDIAPLMLTSLTKIEPYGA
jgi:hypothetical protein